MVKPDMDRDYYADLELPPSADVSDVKKAFKKLALKYHPDRNPGREAEVNSQFQIIQSAHEILSSPESKSKYDAQRTRSRYPRASGVKGNPWQDAAKAYPPPPQRRANPPSRPAPTSTSRYEKFTSAASGRPPPARPETEEDIKSRAHAFESMRPKSSRRAAPTAANVFGTSGSKGSGASAGASGGTWASSGPGASPTSADSTRGRPQEPRQPFTASQAKKAEASFGSRPAHRSARSGFVPQSPSGDEPPVTGKNYINRRHTSLFNEVTPGARHARPPSSADEAADPNFVDPFLDNRQPSPYRARGGEKLNPFDGVNMSRTKSTRETSSRHDDDDDSPFSPTNNRPRSFSVADEPAGEEGGDFRRPSAAGRDANQDPATPRSTRRYSPTPGVDGAAWDDSSVPGAVPNRGANPAHQRRSTANGQPSVYDPTSNLPFIQTRPESTHVNGRTEQQGRPQFSSENSTSQESAKLSLLEQRQYEQLHDLLGKVQSPAAQQPPAHSGATSHRGSNSNQGQTDSNGQTSFPSQRADQEGIDVSAASNQSRFMRSSADNINTRFVAEDHANTNWQFNAGGDLGTTANGAGGRRSQSSGVGGRRSPVKGRPGAESPRPAPAAGTSAAGIGLGISAAAAAAAAAATAASQFRTKPSVSDETAANGSPNVGFDAQGWSHQIGSEHFVPAHQGRPSTSPTRAMRSAKRRPVRVTRGGSAGLVDDEDTTSGEERATEANLHGWADSPNAMDIDTPTGKAASTPQPPTAANGVRGVPVEPSRPDWRAGAVDGPRAATAENLADDAAKAADPGSSSTPGPKTSVPLGSTPGLTPTHSPVTRKPLPPKFSANTAAGSEDTDDFRTGFGDFKNVPPFTTPAAGLSSFDDLKDNLPFQSRAAEHNHLERKKPKTSGTSVNFPKAPVAPRPPVSLAVTGLTVNRDVWAKYVHDFEQYLLEWDHFNLKFIDHLRARQNLIDELKKRTGIATARRETLEDYHDWLEQDKTVHEKWTFYITEHLNRVREFMTHRDKVEGAH